MFINRIYMNNITSIKIPDIHIGNEINAYLKDKGVTKAKLARDLGLDSAYFGKLLNKKSLETHILAKICNATGHNFFILWCENISSDHINTTITVEPETIGKIIENRLYELRLPQRYLAAQLGVSQPEVNRILKKTSITSDKLAVISRILEKNFFNEYCLNNEPKQVNNDTSEGDSLLIKRYENLVIENSRLKQELTDARMEIARLRCTV